jgi:hypothetical protein
LYLIDLEDVNKPEFLDYYYRCIAFGIPVCEDADFRIDDNNQIGISLERVEDIDVTLPSFVDFVYHGGKYIQSLDLNKVTCIEEKGLVDSVSLEKVCGKELLTCKNKSFYLCSGLEEVDFPCLRTIGRSSFQGCVPLKDVNFPNLVLIEDYAFEFTNIHNFNGKQVEFIGDAAFQHTPLTILDVPNCKELHDIFKNKNKKVLLRVRKDCTISVHRGTDYYSLSEYEKYAETHPGMSFSQICSVLSKHTSSAKLS